MVQEKKQNLVWLMQKRDQTNEIVKNLREEVYHLHKPPCNIGEFVWFIGEDKALVKMAHEGKYVVKISEKVDKT